MTKPISRHPLYYYLICVLLVAVIFPRGNSQSLPEPVREQLLNGLTILFWPRPADPNVLLKLRVNSGAAFDMSGKGGTMALLGDALFPDPATREYVTEQLGGQLTVSTNYDSIEVTISGKASELERIVDLLRGAFVGMQLTPEIVSKIRDARLDQLRKQTVSASQMADEAISARLFRNFPYGHPPGGTIETVSKIERADLMLARERFLNPDNATLAVIGGIDKARGMRVLRQLLGPWTKGDRTVPATFRQPDPPDGKVQVVNQPNADMAEVRLAVTGLSRSDRDAAAASLLALIARDRWQATVADLLSPFARHEAHALPGLFVMGAAMPTAFASKAVTAAQQIMKSLAQTGSTAAELERARNQVLSELSGRAAQPDAVADFWLDRETFKVPPYNNQMNAIRDLTLADLQRVAGKLFKDRAVATVVVGNSDQLKTIFGSSAELQKDEKPKPKTAADPPMPAKKP